jgi:hypothetical protein
MNTKLALLDKLSKNLGLQDKQQSTTVINGNLNSNIDNSKTINSVSGLSKIEELSVVNALFASLLPKPILLE